MAYPLQRVQVEVLDLPVVEVASEADPVVCHMWLFANDNDIVLATSGIQLQEFLASKSSVC
jgi:hypothetical protein